MYYTDKILKEFKEKVAKHKQDLSCFLRNQISYCDDLMKEIESDDKVWCSKCDKMVPMESAHSVGEMGDGNVNCSKCYNP
jgi:hypothetical protein